MQKNTNFTPKPQNPPKKSKPKRTNRIYSIAILIIVVCFSATLLGLDYLLDGYVLGDADQVSATPKTNYYCVQMGMYADRATAEYYANSVTARGGAGFILFDKSYRIIASIYGELSHAESVINRLTNSGTICSLYVITIPSYLDLSLSISDRESLATISALTDYAYTALYELSNEIDLETVTPSELNGKLSELKNTVDEHQKLLDGIQTSQNLEISAHVSTISEILNDLPLSPKSSDLRYAYTAILISRTSR